MLFLLAIAGAFASSGPIVVDTTSNLTAEQLQELGQAAGVELHWVDPDVASEGIAVGDATDVEQALRVLSASPLVEIAGADGTIVIPADEQGTLVESDPSTTGFPNDPDFAKQWHMRDSTMDSTWVWANTKKGAGIVVAILDTGFSLTSDFDPSHVFKGKSFISGETLKDFNGHGTHCAATVAEWTDNNVGVTGLAHSAMILPVKVLSDSGSGSYSGIVAGIEWAADHGADVISMSLGGSSHSTAIEKAVKYAISKGVVVVAAAGNENSSRFGSPGDIPELTTVGALGPTGERAFYSNYGARVDIFAPGGDKNFPGGGVFQYTAPRGKEGLYEYQGTSMATPHMAAAAAIVLGEGICPKSADRQVCFDKLIAETATPKASDKPSEYGKGLISLPKAVQKGTGKTTVITSSPTTLPYSNPAGNLTYAIAGLAGLLSYLLYRTYPSGKRFYGVSAGAAVSSAGALWGLTFLPMNLHALSLFMVPWYEFPEYLFGPGASGFPLWLSPLPLVVPFLFMTPIKVLRPVIVGLCVSASAYLLLDAALLFNPPWLMNTVGDAIWLGVSALTTATMAVVACVWEGRKHEFE